MKKLYMLSLTALLMAACAEEVTEKGNNGDFITFNVTENNLLPEPTVSTAAAEVPSFFNQTTPQTTVTAPIVSTPEPVKVKTNIELDEPLYMTTTIEKGIQMSNNHNTMRGSLIDENQTIKTITFGVTEFPAGSNTAVTGFNNPKSFSATSNEFTAQPVSTGLTWESNATTQGYDFYAYAPYLSSSNYGLSLTDNNKSISYNSKAAGLTIANQQDLMTAVAEDVNYTTSGVNLTFNHRLTAVKIVLSDTWSTYKITSVKFSSIYYKGKVAIQTGEWTLTDSDKGEYEITGTFNTANKEIAAYLMMIPQTLSTDMIITFKDGNNQTITFEVPLTTTWSPGATVTYTIGAQGITTFQAVYPNGTNAWGGNTQGPVSAYQLTTANGNEAFGMYVADTDGNLVYSNIKMNVTSVSGYNATLSVASDPGYFFSKNYRYFLYYPYKSEYTASSVTPKSGSTPVTDADTFLGNIASGWPVEADQSDLNNFRLSDLQTSKMDLSGTTLLATMKHKKGVAEIELKTATYYAIVEANNGTSTITRTSNTNESVKASNSFASTGSYHVPVQKGSTDYYYAVVQTGTATTQFNSNSGTDQWASAYTATEIASGGLGHFEAYSTRVGTSTYSGQFSYSGTYLTFTVPFTGTYTIECWGAGVENGGAYVMGKKLFEKDNILYIYVGTQGKHSTNSILFGGGGISTNGPSGSGATDVRLIKDDLYSRIIVAGGQGGMGGYIAPAGGVTGYKGGHSINYAEGNGGGQTDGGAAPTKFSGGRSNGTKGAFGTGGTGGVSSDYATGGGGGGGWYGGSGGSGASSGSFDGGGGSSFISGHPGCNGYDNANNRHMGTGNSSVILVNGAYESITFETYKMICGYGRLWNGTSYSGTELMPNPEGGYYNSGKGHTGNGYCRITGKSGL